MKALIVFIPALALAGCASSGDYKQYVAAQQEANRIAADTQKPLVRITAQPGQAITGLASLEVYTPTAAPVIQQERPNEWVGVIGQSLGIIGTVASLKVSGDAAIGLADSVGKWATAGYSSVQAPPGNISAVTTTTTTLTDASNRSTTTDASNRAVSSVGDNSGANSGNSGRIAGTAMSDSTSTPTVVNQPAPVVVTQPAPVVVTQPAPVVVTQPAPVVVTP